MSLIKKLFACGLCPESFHSPNELVHHICDIHVKAEDKGEISETESEPDSEAEGKLPEYDLEILLKTCVAEFKDPDSSPAKAAVDEVAQNSHSNED